MTDKVTVSKSELEDLVTAAFKKQQQGPPLSWEGQGPGICERALERCYGDAETTVQGLITEACSNSDVANALGYSWGGYRAEPPRRDDVEPFVRASVNEALQVRGKKPWPAKPVEPAQPPPLTAEDLAREALDRTLADPPQPSAQEWYLPRYESVGTGVNARARVVGMERVAIPAPTIEEAAAQRLLRTCQGNPGIAAVVFPGVQYSYALGSSRDLDRCLDLVRKVAKK